MPKKARHESQEEQSERFKREVQRLIDAGELNPTEADSVFEKLVEKIRNKDAGNSSTNRDQASDENIIPDNSRKNVKKNGGKIGI